MQSARGAPVVGERRQVTAVFYDIVNSTQRLSEGDPEQFRLAQRRVHQEAAAAMERFGGYLGATHGDGGCAFFGVPLAMEDAAECAVAAALALLARRADPTAGAAPLQIRVGIATGTVVLDVTANEEPTVVGEVVGLPVNLAARAQACAAPNTVVVAEATYELTRRSFVYEPAGAHLFKGFAEPQALWRAVGRRESEHRISEEGAAGPPLVGRTAELELLQRALAAARTGSRRAVLVAGEPGLGKTRLVAEFRRKLRPDQEVRVFYCHPRSSTSPLHPFVPELQRMWEHERLPRSAPDDLREVIGFLLDKGEDHGSGLVEASKTEVRRRILDAMRTIVEAWAREGPQLLIVEDLQWADSLTRDLLTELAGSSDPLPLLLVLTTRRTSGLEFPQESFERIELSPLSSHEIVDVARAAWLPDALPSELARFICELSDGVPLFAEELARYLRKHGSDEGLGGRRANLLQRSGNVVTLQDLLSARLEHAGRARRLAQMASVLGRDFELATVRELAGGDVGALSVDEAVAKLLEAQLVEVSGPERYRFRHALLADAAYDSLLKSDRQELHSRLVEKARSHSEFTLTSEQLAWHCEQAGLLVEAVEFSLRAAEACSARGALVEAELLLRRAELLLGRADASADTKEKLRMQLLAILGPVAVALHGSGSPEAQRVYEEGVALCQARAPDERETWFPLYWGWWFTAPNFELQRRRSTTIVGDLGQANDPEVRLQALHCAWATEFNTGNHSECLCRIEQGLSLYQPERAVHARLRYGGHDAKVCALGERGLAEWFMGRDDEALSSVNAAVEWAEKIDHLGSLCHALDIALMLCFCRRDLPQLVQTAERVRVIADANALPLLQAKAKIFRGWASCLTEPGGPGYDELESGLGLLARIGTEEDFPVYQEMQAELLGRRGQIERALSAVDRTIDRATAAGHLFWVPELFRRRALLREMRRDDPRSCLEDLERARELAAGQRATRLVERALGDAARIRAAREFAGP